VAVAEPRRIEEDARLGVVRTAFERLTDRPADVREREERVKSEDEPV